MVNTISLAFDRPYYYKGSQVNGKIYLNITHSAQACDLWLELKGIEECASTYAYDVPGSTDFSGNMLIYAGFELIPQTHTIINKKFHIHHWSTLTILKGHYEFPFCFI